MKHPGGLLSEYWDNISSGVFMEKERKVEYIELIYDLIFVYSFRRNNTLMGVTEGGFVQAPEFFAYVLCTLAVIQIWNYSTYYINLYGENSRRNHIFLFINMFLLYFMGVGDKAQLQHYQIQHHTAWGLILLNLTVQYVIEWFRAKGDPVKQKAIRRMILVLGLETVLILATIPLTGLPGIFVPLAVILVTIAATWYARKGSVVPVDFMHLTERAMLLVVLTFGEMIIALTDYFHDGINLNTIYFALMAFLVVIGLFLSYGLHYDRIIDREKKTNGVNYIYIHILIILALNFVTCSLEYMHEEEVSLMPKMIMLICSLLSYYVFLFMTRVAAKPAFLNDRRFYLTAGAAAGVFSALMILLREQMRLNIAVTVIFVFFLYHLLYSKTRGQTAEEDLSL